MKRLLGYTAIVLATLTAMLVLWQFRVVFALFICSLVVAAAVRPLVTRLENLGLPRSTAVFLVYVVGLIFLATTILIVGGQLLDELRVLTDELAASYEVTYPEWVTGSSFQQMVAARFPAPHALYESLTGKQGGALGQRILGLTRGLLGFGGVVILVLVLSAYWTIDQTRFERLWLSVLPASHRARARTIWQNTVEGTGNYLRSEVFQSVIAFFVLGLGYLALGLEFPLILAMFGALVWLIPIVGVLLTIPPLLAAGIQNGPIMVIAAVVFTIIVLWFLEFYVEPRLSNRNRYSNAILSVLLMLVLIEDFGLLGLPLAPPLAAAIQSLATGLLKPIDLGAVREPDKQIAVLKERLNALRVKAADNEDNVPPPDTANLAERLEKLLNKAAQTLPREEGQQAPEAPGST